MPNGLFAAKMRTRDRRGELGKRRASRLSTTLRENLGLERPAPREWENRIPKPASAAR